VACFSKKLKVESARTETIGRYRGQWRIAVPGDAEKERGTAASLVINQLARYTGRFDVSVGIMEEESSRW
jgi:hypothetical protein